MGMLMICESGGDGARRRSDMRMKSICYKSSLMRGIMIAELRMVAYFCGVNWSLLRLTTTFLTACTDMSDTNLTTEGNQMTRADIQTEICPESLHD